MYKSIYFKNVMKSQSAREGESRGLTSLLVICDTFLPSSVMILTGLICLTLFLIAVITFHFYQQKTKEFLKIVNECRLEHETQDLSFKTAVKFMMVRFEKNESTNNFSNSVFTHLSRQGNSMYVELLICMRIMKSPGIESSWPDLIQPWNH